MLSPARAVPLGLLTIDELRTHSVCVHILATPPSGAGGAADADPCQVPPSATHEVTTLLLAFFDQPSKGGSRLEQAAVAGSQRGGISNAKYLALHGKPVHLVRGRRKELHAGELGGDDLI